MDHNELSTSITDDCSGDQFTGGTGNAAMIPFIKTCPSPEYSTICARRTAVDCDLFALCIEAIAVDTTTCPSYCPPENIAQAS